MPGLVPDGNGIKLRQLLNHTAGLYNYTDGLGDTAGIVRERFVHWDPRRAVGMATAREPLFAPGTSRSYSNTNYIVAGLIIEAATRNSYAAEYEAAFSNRSNCSRHRCRVTRWACRSHTPTATWLSRASWWI